MLIVLAVIFGFLAWLYETGGSISALVSSIPQTLIESVAQAIATAEGFYSDGSIPQQANNPGDIADNGFTSWTGDTGGRLTSGNGSAIIIFDSVSDGWNALYKLVNTILSGGGSYSTSMTLSDLGSTYADDPVNWPVNVAHVLGVPVTTTIAQLVAGAGGTAI